MPFPDPRLHERRRLVAQLLLRHCSTREIANLLQRQGWAASQATVVRDIQVIEADWRQAAARDLGEHKAFLLAECRELRRVQWAKAAPDFGVIQRGIEFEAKLLGLYDWTPPVASIEEQIAELGLDPQDVLRQVEELLAGNTEQE